MNKVPIGSHKPFKSFPDVTYLIPFKTFYVIAEPCENLFINSISYQKYCYIIWELDIKKEKITVVDVNVGNKLTFLVIPRNEFQSDADLFGSKVIVYWYMF